MTRIPVLLCSLLLSAMSFAQDPAESFASRYESQLHLLGDTPTTPPGQTPFSTMQESASPKKKVVGLAAIYSLVVPGMGELYADGFGTGKYFLAAEGVLWLTYAAFEIHGNSLRDDARTYAISRAGIDPQGKSDQFFVDIGNFLTVHDYNEKQLRDRELRKVYDPNAGFAWRWESDAARAQYRAQRIDAETMFNNKKFVVAAVIINHVASAINAARSAIAYNRALEDALGDLNIKADVWGGLANPHGIVVTVSRTF